MTIVQMRYFSTVCACGTISKAAEVLHVSQPSISMAIKELENEFGIALFERENKQRKISQEGHYILSQVNEILRSIDLLEATMADMGHHQNQLSLVLPGLTGKFLFYRLLGEFRKIHPEIRFDLKQLDAQLAFNALERGTCTAALIVEPDELPDFIACQRVVTSECVYCTNPTAPLAKKKFVTLEDIQEYPLILNEEQAFMTQQIKRRFYDRRLVPNIILYAAQLSLIRQFVSESQAGTFLLRELAETLPDMVAIPMEDPLALNFALVWNKKKPNNKSARTLIEYIVEKSKEENES